MTVEFGERNELFIGGSWITAEGTERIEVISPYTESVIGSVPAPTRAEVDAAVRAAKHVYARGDWRLTPLEERIAKLAQLADRYQAITEQMGQTLTAEMGAVITWTTASQAIGSAMLIRAYLEEATTYPFEEERLNGRATIVREPVGVVAAIPPWNVAQSTTLSKVVPALLTGCSVVVKPSPETPFDALLLAKLVEEVDFPAGSVSILPAGREIGEFLVAHRDVNHVAFTGSTAAGRRIASVCGQDLRRVTLELGGKSAAIVLEDADLERTVAGLKTNSFNVSGQACIAHTRILAPRRRYDEVVEALAEMVGNLRLGDPADPTTEIGPLVSSNQKKRVLDYIAIGEAGGAKAVVGGSGAPAGHDRGWFVAPTVFAQVSNDMRIAREEIFGPVVGVISYESEEEAIAIANDSDYGLAGTVWTTDEAHGEEIARKVQTGMIGVNGFRPDFSMPFGGVKASGVGREFSREGIDAYVEPKAIYRFGGQVQ